MEKEITKNLLQNKVCMFCHFGVYNIQPVSGDDCKANNWNCFSTVTYNPDPMNLWGESNHTGTRLYRQILRCVVDTPIAAEEHTAPEVQRRHTCPKWHEKVQRKI